MGDERILGDNDFVESVLRLAEEEYEKKTMALASGLDLDTLISKVLKYFEIERDILISSSRQRNVARSRAIICCLAVDRLKISGVDVADKLELTPSAVSKLAARGRLDSLTNPVLRENCRNGTLFSTPPRGISALTVVCNAWEALCF